MSFGETQPKTKGEMTIDIGFAQIEFPKLGTVSVIDVPGHERFIRNMVAGAWGIDLALLVVAVDEQQKMPDWVVLYQQ